MLIGEVMRSDKRYTNAKFSKWVDHEAGRHRPPRGMEEPAICRECGAVYAERRWQKSNPAQKNRKHKEWRPAHVVVCPARSLTLATTTELLAQRLGRALEQAFGGSVSYDFSRENKLARVTWHHD